MFGITLFSFVLLLIDDWWCKSTFTKFFLHVKVYIAKHSSFSLEKFHSKPTKNNSSHSGTAFNQIYWLLLNLLGPPAINHHGVYVLFICDNIIFYDECTVCVKSFEGESCGFCRFLLTANVLPLKIFLEYQRRSLTTQNMVPSGLKFSTAKVFPTY